MIIGAKYMRKYLIGFLGNEMKMEKWNEAIFPFVSFCDG